MFAIFTAVAVIASCGEKEEQPVTPTNPTVGISASAISGGSATLTLSLSAASSSAVSVSLSASGTLASSLTFDKAVSIAAGKTSATVPVTVKQEGLEPGTYEATVSIASASGATVNSSAKSASLSLTVEGPKTAVVAISAFDADFVDNKANITLTLSNALEQTATVTLATGSNQEGLPVVPDEALTYEKSISFEAGKLSKTIVVEVDPEQLLPGESVVTIEISSVSDNLTVESTKQRADIVFTKNLEANERTDWNIAYDGQVEREEKELAVITVAGLGDEASYYLYIYEKGTVAGHFDTVQEYLEYMSDYINNAIGTEKAPIIRKGDKSYEFALNPGDYEVWVLGCSDGGHLIGDYASGEFTIEASEDALEAYNKWIGEWKVTRGSNPTPDVWKIMERVPGGSFFIYGIDGDAGSIADVAVVADYDTANDAIILYTQDNLKTFTFDGTEYYLGLYGMFNGEIYSGEYDIAYILKTGENTATIKGFEYEVDGPCTGMTLFAAPAEGGNGYVFNGQVFYTWPETMEMIVPEEGNPDYEAFLGYWTIKRNDSEWNSATKKWKDLGEVTDVIYIEPKIAGYSYSIYGIEGFDVEVEANYNDADKTMFVKEQTVYQGEDEGENFDVRLCGQISYQGKTYLWDNGATIFTAKAQDGKISLTPGSTQGYGKFIGVKFFVYFPSEDAYGSYHNEGYPLPNELLYYEGGDEPEETALRKAPAAQKNRGMRVNNLSRKSVSRSVRTNPLTVSAERIAR